MMYNMHNLLILFTIFILSFNVIAKEEKELPPLDPEYVGVHGMVLVTHGSRIYASHLPLYHKPHDVQLVYKIESKEIPFLNLVRDAELVTIKPKPFNLQRLMRGEKMTVVADVYRGHFEREGEKIYSDKTIVFDKQLYVRKLEKLAQPSAWQEYDVIEVGKTERIYIHKISKQPSFDHLLHVDLEGACLKKFKTSEMVPSEKELQYKFLNCGTMKPLYYETEDFKKPKAKMF